MKGQYEQTVTLPSGSEIEAALGLDQAESAQQLIRRTRHRFLLIAPLLTLVFLFFYGLGFYLYAQVEQAKLDHQTILAMDGAREHASADFEGVLADLDFLANSLQVRRFLTQTQHESDRQAVEYLFLELSKSHRVFDQVRLLSPEGQELVRINFHGGNPQVVPLQQLQNKADRYYFREASASTGNTIYVSRLDLNIEHGVVEEPFKPMIRFAKPIRSAQNQLLGVLVLNYFGDQFLEHFRSHIRNLPGESMLLNLDGHWLVSEDEQREWGFMFEQSTTFGSLFPEVWAQVLEREAGVMVDGRGRFVFATVQPMPVELLAGRNDRHALNDWKVVAIRRQEGVNLDYLLSNMGHIYPLLVLYPLALLLLWFWARASSGRQQAEEGMVKLNRSLERQVKSRTAELQATKDVTIMSLASLTETRDNETGHHIRRTQNYIRVLANDLKDHPDFRDQLSDEVIDLIFKSAPLHDIGKVGIPDAILLKPGRLTDAEFEVMKKHTLYGYEAITDAIDSLSKSLAIEESGTFLHYARDIAHYHHERWDGRGYPEGLAGEEIPLAARLMAIADVYDALVSERAYKRAMSRERVEQIMIEQSEGQFDPRILQAFVRNREQFWAIKERFANGQKKSEEPGKYLFWGAGI